MLGSSWLLSSLQLTQFVGGDRLHPLDARGRPELEAPGVQLGLEVPVVEADGVLGGTGGPLAGDDVLEGEWLVTALHPELPVHLASAEREVVARDAIHH